MLVKVFVYCDEGSLLRKSWVNKKLKLIPSCQDLSNFYWYCWCYCYSIHCVSDESNLIGKTKKLKLREHLAEKKCFLSGIARMRGGEAPARIKKYNIYIYI